MIVVPPNEIPGEFIDRYIDELMSLCRSDFIKLPMGCLYEVDFWDIYLIERYFELSSSDRVLDAGGLYGFHMLHFLNSVQSIHVVDNYQVLAMLHMRGIMSPGDWEEYISSKSGGRIIPSFGHLTNLQYPDNYFDKVICTRTLERTVLDKQAISEIMRVVKPGGRIYFSTSYNEVEPMGYIPEIQFRVYDRQALSLAFEGLNFTMTFIDKNEVDQSGEWPRYGRISFQIIK